MSWLCRYTKAAEVDDSLHTQRRAHTTGIGQKCSEFRSASEEGSGHPGWMPQVITKLHGMPHVNVRLLHTNRGSRSSGRMCSFILSLLADESNISSESQVHLCHLVIGVVCSG